MTTLPRAHRPRRPAWLLSLCLTVPLVACGAPRPAPAPAPGPQVIGLVEVSLHGLGSDAPVTTLRTLKPPAALTPQATTHQPGGLQLEPLTLTVFNTGTRGVDGRRYVSATYRVRNADSDGTPTARARKNITLIAVNAGDTLDGTAFRAVTTFDGSAAEAGLARTFLPTHAMRIDPLRAAPVLSAGGEDLQVYRESEVAPGALRDPAGQPLTYAQLGVNSVLPYGFVVRTLAGSRTLGASPAPAQFDGRVTFSVSLPLQPDDPARTPTQGSRRDPWGFRMVLLVVEDDVTRVTQSLDEQALGNAAVNARAALAGATEVNVLPGSSYPAGVTGAVPARCIPEVRVAGQAGDPAATYLVKGSSCP